MLKLRATPAAVAIGRRLRHSGGRCDPLEDLSGHGDSEGIVRGLKLTGHLLQ